MRRVQITINGLATDVDHHITVAALVSGRAEEHSRVAVAVNAEVVPRSQWDMAQLEPADRVELLTATAGG